MSAFWRSRPATLGEAVDVLVRLRNRLGALGPPFDALYESTRKGRLLWTEDRDSMTAALLRGRNWSDIPREVIPELGYSFGTWQKAVRGWTDAVWLTIGATAPGEYPNAVHVHPAGGIAGEASDSKLISIMNILIDVLDPDWVEISSNGIRALTQDRPTKAEPRVGWFLYVSDDELSFRRSIPPLPPPASAAHHGRGVLLRLTEDRFDPEEPTHLEALRAVTEGLRAAGFLEKRSVSSS